MICGILLARYHHKRPPTRKGVIASAAAIVTGTVAGAAGYVLASLPPLQSDGSLEDPRLYTCVGFPVVMLLFMLAATLLVGGTSYITEDEDREWWARAGGWLLLVSITWPVFSALVLYASATINWFDLRLTSSLAGGAGITGWLTSSLSASSRTSAGRREEGVPGEGMERSFNFGEVLSKLFFPVFLCLLVILLAGGNSALMNRMGEIVNPLSIWPVVWLWVVYAFICAPAAYFINVNKFSLHGMYRQRLIRAFLGASNDQRNPHPFTGFDEDDNVTMAELSPQKPLHVVNMALNLVGGENLAWQQRKAASFTSTRLHTGSCRVGYQPSRVYGGRFRQNKTPISLGTAITISGAAASPNMGYNSSPPLAFVMTLFNARLGCWLGNPAKEARVWKRPGPRWGIRAFVDEAFGLTTDRNNWVYLSDGGHFDNLGLYEMILRRCHTIVAVDASADPGFTYEDLGNAVRKVRVDLGVPVELDTEYMPTSLPRAEESRKRFHFATARILYSAIDGPLADGKAPEDGVLVYIKPCLTGDEPPDVKQYASTDPRFPHQPTSDQFFDEAQFESYRRLGLHTIDAVCGDGWPFDQEPANKLSLNEFVSRAAGHIHGTAAKQAAV